MVPLVLLLLLSESLADQVCLHISDGNIAINMMDPIFNMTTIVDERSGSVNCLANDFPCLFECTFSSVMQWFNGSSDCLEASVTPPPPAFKISIGQYSICRLYPCDDDTILPIVKLLDTVSSDQEDMMKLFYIKSSCLQLFSINHGVKKAFLSAERQMIHNIMGTSVLESGGSANHKLKLLSLNVLNISDADLEVYKLRIQIAAPQLLPQNESFIPEVWLPTHALATIPTEERAIGVVSYMHHSQFQFKEEEISSMVLRIELLGEQRLKDLKTPIKMTFRTTHTDIDNGSRFQCHYFDEDDWLWKTDGCETDDNQTDIVCNCNHTTPFAVLLVRDPIAAIHWEILSYISYIGCGLSAFFTALSLVIYVFGRKHRMDYSISIHVSLSGALFLLNTTFLLTEWGATVKQHWVCVFVAALMHYSLLCCFTWMAIEALHLYLLLIKVFNTYFKHYLVKLSLAGWGIPGVIVLVSLGVKDFKQFYGLTEMTMADTNQTNAICWITDDSFFYSLNLVYFTLIFIFNSGILMVVASNICKMKQVFRSNTKLGAEADGKTPRDSERFNETCRSGLTVMGLTCLMGTTWGLAFLGSGYVNYPILYLFCILNSTQGFFIFLWICLSAKKQRKRDMEDRLTSSAVKTSGVKYE